MPDHINTTYARSLSRRADKPLRRILGRYGSRLEFIAWLEQRSGLWHGHQPDAALERLVAKWRTER